ncbi:pilus assembly protein TadG-related protein [Algirhabdus cladophorae]|uniref:pilus assembly protein TadG-related protein n=2 Tax=Pseudomonadota TaxID=1224 RepID=UPI003B84837A
MFWTEKTDKAKRSRSLRAASARFAKEEDGSLTIFSLYIFIIMVSLGGLAMDVMHFDTVQTKLQNTADRASLAAADLDQSLNGYAVVNDYFDKAEMSKYLKATDVRGGINWREVEIHTEAVIPTYFMFWTSDAHQLTAKADSIASEKVTDIEISLVIDISGSMGSNNRLPRLKVAAGEFFDAVIKNTTDPNLGITSVSIIPYNHSVNVGPDILAHYNPTTKHNESYCIRFTSNNMKWRGQSTTNSLNRIAHFTQNDQGISSSTDMYRVPDSWEFWCRNDSRTEIMPFQFDKQKLKDHVNAFYASGWTGIDNGMKWASILLDPSSRPVITNLKNAGKVPTLLAGRPVGYDNSENMKVIVLMTDGANTLQRDLKSKYKNNKSDVWYSPSRDEWMVKIKANTSSKRWYYPYDADTGSDDVYRSYKRSDAIRYTYQDLYKIWGVDDFSDYFYRRSNTALYEEHNDVVETYIENGDIDDNVKLICNAVKAKNTSIFAIGFEAPTRGQDIMRECASSDGHYFDVDGTEITTAFKAIASQINRLRLTQ